MSRVSYGFSKWKDLHFKMCETKMPVLCLKLILNLPSFLPLFIISHQKIFKHSKFLVLDLNLCPIVLSVSVDSILNI